MGIFTGYPEFLASLLSEAVHPLRLYDELGPVQTGPPGLLGTYEEDIHVIPIGGIYISTVDTDPGFTQANGGVGYGAWVRTSLGRALVGVDEADPDWDMGGEEAGFKLETPTGVVSAPTFTGAPMAVHTHELPFSKNDLATGQMKVLSPTVFGSGTSRVPQSITAAPAANTVTAPVALAESRTAGTPAGTVSAPDFVGDLMSVVQPSFAVFIWRRTA